MKNPDKIINGFLYIQDEDTVVFISLYTEQKQYYESILFNKFLKDYKINKKHIILAHEEHGNVTPLYTTRHKGGCDVAELDFDKLIQEVYSICIEVTKYNF
jgi:cysteine sulfinate desulfinase/cysteine desulfurase-like protein